jgi:superfamily II DNA or RNA helicase
MAPELYPFQLDLVDRTAQAATQGAKRIIVQGATGMGKTNCAAYIIRRAANKGSDALFMVHRRKLVDQISSRLHDFEVQHGIIMRDETPDRGCHVQVASRDTLISRSVNNCWAGMPPAQLVVVDEAHHAADPSSEYRRILEYYERLGATILLLTATPVGTDGQGMGPWAQALVCAEPTSKLVEQGYLCPVKVYAPERKQKGKRLLRGIAGDLVESWKQYAEGQPTILFCGRVSHSLDAVKAFEAEGIRAVHIDASTPDDERDRAFDAVADGRIKVLSNVGIVGEGVDVPELSVCQFFCEVNGRVKWLQGIGRVMRRAPGKDHGIVIDHAGAVFRLGFPDEDTPWTLEGNTDEAYQKKHDDDQTPKAYYCKHCELAYHGQDQCPQCGKAPSKPPKSVFEAPPVRPRNELLTEAERGQQAEADAGEKIGTWFACLAVAKKRNGTFKMASTIFKNKYGQWPPADFPHMPPWGERGRKVAEVMAEAQSSRP